MKSRINTAGEVEIYHCAWHEPDQSPEVRAQIEELCREFNTQLVNSGLCPECQAKFFPKTNLAQHEN